MWVRVVTVVVLCSWLPAAALPPGLHTASDNTRFNPKQGYSTHTCMGARGVFKLEEGMYCALHNVCWDPTVWPGGLLYYEDPVATATAGERSPKYWANGTHYDTFPAFQWCNHPQPLVRMANHPFPRNPAWADAKVVALACPVHCAWWPHMWLDNIFPYFHTARLLRLWDPLEFSIVWSASRRHLASSAGEKHPCQCSKFFREWVYPSGIASNRTGCRLWRKGSAPICFHNIILGGNAFGYWQHLEQQKDDDDGLLAGLGDALWDMRSLVRFGLAGLTDADGPSSNRVLVVRKTLHKRRIVNSAEIVARLRTCYPSLPIEETAFGMSPREQLLLVNSMSVVITPSGSISYTVMFAPRHLVVIQVDRWLPSVRFTHGADQYAFMNMPFLHFMALPVTEENIHLEIPSALRRLKMNNPDKKYDGFGSVRLNASAVVRALFWGLRKAAEVRNNAQSFVENSCACCLR
eukprot:NODE_2047_length_1528_cov_117.881851_g1949_i0.p1 GENE.NODE_2047_length_1528_cov_117.881851_g1949_i0~~NODE_2047_length_1528_cov_117.881851_g1949_i0.p1  ORF type:complete len:464 (-),score=47.89 NODE_2047_length_1528_cov_117.881851_g1949_i0:60-1451(-)